MKQHGRKSAAALAVITPEKNAPEPSEHLTDEEKMIWRRVTGALSYDWFTDENVDLLEQYCRLISRLRSIGAQLSGKKVQTKEFIRLATLENKLTHTLASLATRMRLAQQSTYSRDKRNKRSVATPVNPWNDDD
jgi:phage terminase small subunit